MLKKLRIAVLEPYIRGMGGAQRVIEEYSTYLKEQGHIVEIFTQNYDSDYSYEGFCKHKINIMGPKLKILSPFAFLSKKFKEYDLVIANDWPTHFTSIRNRNTVWICYTPKRDFYDLRNYFLKEARFREMIVLRLKRLLFQRIDTLCAKRVKKILVSSKNVQNRVLKYYNLSSKIIYHGIRTKRYQYRPAKLNNYFLCVSRLVKPKRVDLVIEAMKFVKNDNLELVVVGDGMEREEIIKLSKENKSVKFLGIVDERELVKLYSNCLGVVYVPIDEDWGLAPLEAAASGKPFIGSNEGGLKESVIRGKTGFLLDKVTPEEIAKKMDLISTNKKIAKKMGLAALRNVKKFEWIHSLKSLEKELISSIVGEN